MLPPEGAAPESVMVPVLDEPPVTDVGEKATLLTTGASTVRVALAELPFAPAVSVSASFEVTDDVVTVKVAVAVPALTVTEDG